MKRGKGRAVVVVIQDSELQLHYRAPRRIPQVRAQDDEGKIVHLLPVQSASGWEFSWCFINSKVLIGISIYPRKQTQNSLELKK